MTTTTRDARNGRPSITPAAPYLLERGFPEWAILEVGWRVEPLGPRYRRYGLPAEAADALVWLIPYRHPNGRVWFERMRFIDPADLERFGGGKYRQPARDQVGTGLQLYDPYLLLSTEKWEPRDSILLIESEANTVAVHTLLPEDAVIGLPGQSTLTQKMARELAAIPWSSCG